MGTRDKRVDAVIAKSQDFAKPIMEHLRTAVHEGCPECEETIKWGMPFFMYKGSILCMMAHFKKHCAFGFWKNAGLGPELQDSAMGSFGKITSIKDLPHRCEARTQAAQGPGKARGTAVLHGRGQKE